MATEPTPPQSRRGWSVRTKAMIAGVVALVLVAVAGVVFVFLRQSNTSEEIGAGEVRPGRENVVVSADGSVTVEIPGEAKSLLADQLDQTFSISADRAPRCENGAGARDDGYDVTSDPGRRAYWCLGIEGGVPTLKAVNARGYGVVTEYAPGLEIKDRQRGGLVDIVADILTASPSLEGNQTVLLPSGNQIEFAVDPDTAATGVQLKPDPGAYLLGALQFAVQTYAALLKKLKVKGGQKKLLQALEGQACLASFGDLATTELTTPGQAREYFTTALGTALDCAAASVEAIDLGLITEFIVEPLIWLASGVKTALDGFVAAADTFDLDGYQITVSHDIAPQITEQSVGELLIPTGTCGDGDEIGWDQVEPIQLAGGEGESFDDDNLGAGILGTTLVGAVDVTGDGADEAFLAVTCTGSPQQLCCAGRSSLLDFVVVLDLSSGTPRRVGDTIIGIDATDSAGTTQPRYFQGEQVTLDGATVVTFQTLIYPEQLASGAVSRLEGEVRYSLRDGRWVPSE